MDWGRAWPHSAACMAGRRRGTSWASGRSLRAECGGNWEEISPPFLLNRPHDAGHEPSSHGPAAATGDHGVFLADRPGVDAVRLLGGGMRHAASPRPGPDRSTRKRRHDTLDSLLPGRRGLLAAFGAAGLSASARPALAAPRRLPLTAQATEGPYYLDLALERRDITEGLDGVPLDVRFTVCDAAGQPLPRLRVDLWHCDAQGATRASASRATTAPSRSKARPSCAAASTPTARAPCPSAPCTRAGMQGAPRTSISR